MEHADSQATIGSIVGVPASARICDPHIRTARLHLDSRHGCETAESAINLRLSKPSFSKEAISPNVRLTTAVVVDHWKSAEALHFLSLTLPDNGGLTGFIDSGNAAISL
jgi:hypothetical protein